MNNSEETFKLFGCAHVHNAHVQNSTICPSLFWSFSVNLNLYSDQPGLGISFSYLRSNCKKKCLLSPGQLTQMACYMESCIPYVYIRFCFPKVLKVEKIK